MEIKNKKFELRMKGRGFKGDIFMMTGSFSTLHCYVSKHMINGNKCKCININVQFLVLILFYNHMI